MLLSADVGEAAIFCCMVNGEVGWVILGRTDRDAKIVLWPQLPFGAAPLPTSEREIKSYTIIKTGYIIP